MTVFKCVLLPASSESRVKTRKTQNNEIVHILKGILRYMAESPGRRSGIPSCVSWNEDCAALCGLFFTGGQYSESQAGGQTPFKGYDSLAIGAIFPPNSSPV